MKVFIFPILPVSFPSFSLPDLHRSLSRPPWWWTSRRQRRDQIVPVTATEAEKPDCDGSLPSPMVQRRWTSRWQLRDQIVPTMMTEEEKPDRYGDDGVDRFLLRHRNLLQIWRQSRDPTTRWWRNSFFSSNDFYCNPRWPILWQLQVAMLSSIVRFPSRLFSGDNCRETASFLRQCGMAAAAALKLCWAKNLGFFKWGYLF